jgi:hypothetical protein
MGINIKTSDQYQGLYELAGDPQNSGLSTGSSGGGYDLAVPDGTSDNTAELQAAINEAATLGKVLELPYGKFNFTDLYLYYDATLNPGYPQGSTKQARLRIRGQGRMYVSNISFNTTTGTILNCTSATGGIHEATPSGGNDFRSEGFIFEGLSIIGTTSGTLVDLQTVNYSVFREVLVVNKSLTGNGVYLGECYIMSFYNFEIVGGTAGFSRQPNLYSSGTGIELNGAGGFISGDFIVGGYNIGTKFSGQHTQIRLGHHEPHHCNIGCVFDGTSIANGVGFNSFWSEGCTYAGLKCINGAPMPSIGTAKIENGVGDWTASRTIAKVGDTLTANGNIYYYTATGTTHSSTAPSGTGTSITDGTATCKYVGALAAETRACIHLADAAIPSEAYRTQLGDLYLIVDSGASALRVTATVNSQEIEVNSLTVAASGLNFSGHGIRTGIYLNDTGQPGVVHVKASQFVGFDTPTDVICNQFSALGSFHQNKKGFTKRVYTTGTAATLPTTNAELIRIIDNTTTITAFEGQYPGTMLIIYMNVAGINITHSSTLVLQGSTNYTSGAGDILTFINTSTSNSLFGNTWTEVSRSVK